MKKTPIKNISKDLINTVVFDKKTKENGVIVSINPIEVALDREEKVIVERKSSELMVYVYEKEDIDRIEEQVKDWAKFFCTSSKPEKD